MRYLLSAVALMATGAAAAEFDPFCHAAAERLAPAVVEARLARDDMGPYDPPADMRAATLEAGRKLEPAECNLLLGMSDGAIRALAAAIVENAMQARLSTEHPSASPEQ